ncbi:MAG: ATP synthase F1 subunit delta [Deltaproteobacteria bacterium]
MGTVATLRDIIEALVASSKESGKLDTVASDMETVFRSLAEDIKNVLGSSVYETADKQAIVGDIGAKLGLDNLTVNFLSLAVELGKFKALMKSEETFMRRLRRASGKVKVEITAAKSLTDIEIDRIGQAFRKLTGREVETSVAVDPRILGGIIAKVENRVYDGSIRNQLEKIRAALC